MAEKKLMMMEIYRGNEPVVVEKVAAGVVVFLWNPKERQVVASHIFSSRPNETIANMLSNFTDTSSIYAKVAGGAEIGGMKIGEKIKNSKLFYEITKLNKNINYLYLLYYLKLMKRFFLLFLVFFSCEGKREFKKIRELERVSVCCVANGRIVCPPPEDGCSDYLPYMKDKKGRYIYLHGINVSGSDKFPVNDDLKTVNLNKTINNAIPTYVGKPFPLDEADKHFTQLRELGFNSIRLIMNWEAIQPEAPDKFDENYLDFIQQIVKKAKEYNIYVLMDMHQDIFSRHLLSRFNDGREFINKEAIKNVVSSIMGSASGGGFISAVDIALAFIPPYNNAVRGDGAPLWAVKAIMPEKDFNSKSWGVPKILGNILDPSFLNSVTSVIKKLGLEKSFGIDISKIDLAGIIKTWITDGLQRNYKYPFDITETTDLLPWTMWGLNGALSLDIQRGFAAFFAGKDAYPKLCVDNLGNNVDCSRGKNIQDFLQEQYAKAWTAVASRVKDFPNVIGYDIINEPVGFFLPLSLVGLYLDFGFGRGITDILGELLADKQLAQDFVNILTGLNLIPPDNSEETKKKWGFEYANTFGLLGLNYGFEKNYMQPFYEKIGREIQKVDPDAIIWIEPALGLEFFLEQILGGGEGEGYFQLNLTRPVGIRQVVYAPHWYPDIYPFPGFNMPPRQFTPAEQRYRSYKPGIEGAIRRARKSLGNIPVVVGEFGTYYNFNGIENSESEDYAVSKEILDNFYEAFEDMFLSHMQWTWTRENSPETGEGWNSEDFSIVDWNLEPRGEEAYSRPHPNFISGKPVSLRFYSYFHYFDPDKGIVNPVGEFELKFESKETDEPTEIFIPYNLYYPQGFYVWLSDGYAVYEHKGKYGFLYYYPTDDEPGITHSIRIMPPLTGQEYFGWQYFFKENSVVARGRSYRKE